MNEEQAELPSIAPGAWELIREELSFSGPFALASSKFKEW